MHRHDDALLAFASVFDCKVVHQQLHTTKHSICDLLVPGAVSRNGLKADTTSQHWHTEYCMFMCARWLSAGEIYALPSVGRRDVKTRGFELFPGMLPTTLQGLTIVARQAASLDFDAGRFHAKVWHT